MTNPSSLLTIMSTLNNAVRSGDRAAHFEALLDLDELAHAAKAGAIHDRASREWEAGCGDVLLALNPYLRLASAIYDGLAARAAGDRPEFESCVEKIRSHLNVDFIEFGESDPAGTHRAHLADAALEVLVRTAA